MTGPDEPIPCSDPTCTMYHPPRRLVEVAGRALERAVAGQREAAQRCVIAIAEGWGADGVSIGITLWIDALVQRTPLRDVDPTRLATMAFSAAQPDGMGVDNTDTQTVDDVPPEIRWAGRYLLAWVLNDTEQLDALGRSVEGDPERMLEVTVATLEMCALGIANPDQVLKTGGGR